MPLKDLKPRLGDGTAENSHIGHRNGKLLRETHNPDKEWH